MIVIVIAIQSKSKMLLFLLVDPGFFTIPLFCRAVSSPFLLWREADARVFCPRGFLTGDKNGIFLLKLEPYAVLTKIAQIIYPNIIQTVYYDGKDICKYH